MRGAVPPLLGADPHSDWLPPPIDRDDRGFVLTGRDLPTRRWTDGRPPADLADAARESGGG